MKNKLVSLVILSIILFVTSGWNAVYEGKISKKCRADFSKFVDQQVAKYQVKLINIGHDFFKKDYQVLWGYAVMDSGQVTIEQARPMMVEMIRDAEDWVRKNQYCMDYLRYSKPKRLNPDREPIYPVLGIKVAFWDQEVNRPAQPYVADMRFEDSLITYYFADPKDQALVPQITETYEEAIKKSKS